jgi:hypothetical protein
MSKTYRNPEPALAAAARVLGGRIATYDGSPVLAVTRTNEYGQAVTEYVSPEVAAAAAGITYAPNSEAWNLDDADRVDQDATWLRGWLGLNK